MTKSEATKHALAAVETWLKARSACLHRDDRSYLIECIAAEFSRETEEAKKPEGVA